jgi:hypothetical protein
MQVVVNTDCEFWMFLWVGNAFTRFPFQYEQVGRPQQARKKCTSIAERADNCVLLPRTSAQVLRNSLNLFGLRKASATFFPYGGEVNQGQ